MSNDNEHGVLSVGTKATVTVLDNEGNVVTTHMCPRSIPSILNQLKQLDNVDGTVKVSLKIAESGEDGKPETAEILLTEGKLDAAIEDVSKRVMTPEQALMQFHLTMSKLMDLADLKCAMITAVFGDGQATGFTVLSESSPVEMSDIQILGASSAAQSKDFKHKMKEGQLKVEFPDDDNSGIIILPPGARVK